MVFVGRREILKTLQNALRLRQSYALLGGPQSGRTSILKEFYTVCEKEWRENPQTSRTKIVPVYFDFASIKHARRPDVFPSKLWEAVQKAVINPYVLSASKPPRSLAFTVTRGEDPWAVYKRIADDFWKQLGGSSGWCRIALLLDNSEGFFDPALRESVQALRGLFIGSELWRPVSLIATGGRLLHASIASGTRVWADLRCLNVGVLSLPEALQLQAELGGGFQLPAQSGHPQADLATYAGRHPFLMTLFSGGITSARASHKTPETVQDMFLAWCARIRSEIVGEAEGRLNDGRGRASLSVAMLLMKVLISAQKPLLYDEAERAVGMGSIREASELLEFLGVIEKTIDHDNGVLFAHMKIFNDEFIGNASTTA